MTPEPTFPLSFDQSTGSITSRLHHIGIPTDPSRPNEKHLAAFAVHVPLLVQPTRY